MSFGSINRQSDPYNFFTKSWAGADDTKYKRAENGYSMTLQSQMSSPPLMVEKRPPPESDITSATWWSNMLPNLTLMNEGEGDVYSKASSKLDTNVRNCDTHFGNVIGEMDKTINSIVDTSKRVLTTVRDLKHGNWRSAARTLFGHGKTPRPLKPKDVSATLLEWRYGWLPLMSDVYGGVEFLQKTRDEQRLVSKTRSTLREDRVVNGLGHKGQFVSSCQIKAILTEDQFPNSIQRSGILDPLVVAWELTPWSFVVDWFIPIGDYLSKQAILGGMNGTFVITYFRSAAFVKSFGVTNAGQPLYWVGGTIDAKSVAVRRTVSSSFPIPLPAFKSLSRALGKEHLQNAAALIHQMVGKAR